MTIGDGNIPACPDSTANQTEPGAVLSDALSDEDFVHPMIQHVRNAIDTLGVFDSLIIVPKDGLPEDFESALTAIAEAIEDLAAAMKAGALSAALRDKEE